MFLSELNEQHTRILQIVYNAEENKDPLYNIRDSRTYRRVLGSVNRMTSQMCGDDAELKSVTEAAKQYCACQVDAGYSYDMEARLVGRPSASPGSRMGGAAAMNLRGSASARRLSMRAMRSSRGMSGSTLRISTRSRRVSIPSSSISCI